MKFTMIDDTETEQARPMPWKELFSNAETDYLLRGIYVETALLRA